MSLSRAIALVACLGIGGCGFHLRGAAEGPAGIGAVQIQAAPGLREGLVSGLQEAGVPVVSAADTAEVSLQASAERMERRVVAVDPRSGKAREYELVYTLQVRAWRPDGQVLLPEQEVRVIREYVFDPDAVLGMSREEAVMRREMQHDAVQQVLRRLAAAARG